MTEQEIERLVQDELVPACIGRFRRLRKYYPHKNVEDLARRARKDVLQKNSWQFLDCTKEEMQKAVTIYSELTGFALNEEIDGPFERPNITGEKTEERVM